MHEHQPCIAKFAADEIHIAAQDGRYIGIDDGRVAASHQLHQRAYLVRDRDLIEPDFARQFGDGFFVIVMPIAMNEHNRGRPDTIGVGFFQGLSRRGQIEWNKYLAIGRATFIDLDNALIKQLG